MGNLKLCLLVTLQAGAVLLSYFGGAVGTPTQDDKVYSEEMKLEKAFEVHNSRNAIDNNNHPKYLREKVTSFHSSKLASLDGSTCGMLSTSQKVTMETGAKFCCHFRKNVHKLQGEVFTYHLSRVLGFVGRVPLTVATSVLFTDERFDKVRSAAASEAKWPHGATIVCSEFIEGLSDVTLPSAMKEAVAGMKTIDDSDSIDPMWAELVVIDYLTGNTDRLVNMLTNYQYNSGILSSPVHNLALDPHGQLVLFDHENSFWIGYQFAKDNQQIRTSQEFFVEKVCVFPDRFLQRISPFCKQPSLLTQKLLESSRVLDKQTMKLVPPLSHDIIEGLETRVTSLCSHLVDTCGLVLPSVS